MKVAIYIRVSTEEQAKEGFSLTTQREYLEEYAKREGHDLYRVYSDDGISGYSERRPALQELLHDAKLRRFDLVIVYKIDRFSRNLKDLLNLVDELSNSGVAFKSATEPFDTSTSAGKLMFQQLGSFAEFERNRLAERVMPGMVKGVQLGNWQGARYSPFGYNYNKAAKVLEVIPEQAPIVKMIFEMAIADKPVRYIREYLTKKGYRNRNGNYFTAKLIRDIIRNPIYTGKLVWNRCHYDKTQKTPKGYRYIKNDSSKVVISLGRHQPLVSDEIFERAQSALAKRRIEHRKRAGDYPLSAVMFCAKCNHKYHGISSIRNHRTNEKSRWYRCAGPQKSFIKCSNKAIKAEDIEPKVSVLLSTLLRSDRLKDSRWKPVTDALREDIQPIDEKERLRLENQLKKLQTKQSKLTDLYLENVLGEDVYHGKMASLRRDEEELKKRLALQEFREIERERSTDYLHRVEDFLAGYQPNKTSLNCYEQKQVLGLLFKNIKIARKDILSFEFFPPFNSLFLEQEKKEKCLKNQKKFAQIRPKYISAHLDVR
ncbi:MAG: recombinase family protein [Candidatus Omnitrophica bacterium]|nr:recombinase family protein [Candidatus Omnitrophota bacterium]